VTRLLLFTNEYPYATGDHVFVESEIQALADRFDSVVVFCHARDRAHPLVDMPPNVTLGGNLYLPAPEDAQLRRLITPANIVQVAAAAWRELIAGRLLAHPRLFLMGVKVGLTQAMRHAVQAAIDGDADVVAYAFWGMGGGLNLPWLRNVRARVLRLHRYDLYEEIAPNGYLPYRQQMFAKADRILALSEPARHYLRRTYRSAALDRKVVVSRLGVFGPQTVERLPRASERLLVSVSSVSRVKRVGLLLEAVRALPRRAGETVRWVHFGDGPLMDELREAASNPPVGLRIEFRGQTANADVHAFYATHRVDAFVNVSSSEGLPFSIMEALAYGVPVVATAVGGVPEIIGPAHRSGELVPADSSPTRIAETLRSVLDVGDDAYDPRAVWQRECDARVTSARAAELIAAQLEATRRQKRRRR
jgi:glycosyltransferase involved in cell wall biosynthesis